MRTLNQLIFKATRQPQNQIEVGEFSANLFSESPRGFSYDICENGRTFAQWRWEGDTQNMRLEIVRKTKQSLLSELSLAIRKAGYWTEYAEVIDYTQD